MQKRLWLGWIFLPLIFMTLTTFGNYTPNDLALDQNDGKGGGGGGAIGFAILIGLFWGLQFLFWMLSDYNWNLKRIWNDIDHSVRDTIIGFAAIATVIFIYYLYETYLH